MKRYTIQIIGMSNNGPNMAIWLIWPYGDIDHIWVIGGEISDLDGPSIGYRLKGHHYKGP